MDSDHGNYYYSSTCFYYCASHGHQPGPLNPTSISIPIHSPHGAAAPVPVRLPAAAAAAVRIQAAYRGHLTRSLVGRIRTVDAEAAVMERRIQRQETVDALRGGEDDRERLRLSEGLMALLFRLDSVPGFYPAVKELRRRASRRIVALQEVVDAILAAPPVPAEGGIPATWEEIVKGMWVEEENEAVEEKGFNCWDKYLMMGV